MTNGSSVTRSESVRSHERWRVCCVAHDVGVILHSSFFIRHSCGAHCAVHFTPLERGIWTDVGFLKAGRLNSEAGYSLVCASPSRIGGTMGNSFHCIEPA